MSNRELLTVGVGVKRPEHSKYRTEEFLSPLFNNTTPKKPTTAIGFKNQIDLLWFLYLLSAPSHFNFNTEREETNNRVSAAVER